jgi:hypothetical protein
VTFILKAEKSENTIIFFPNKKILYMLMYIEYSKIFFCVFQFFSTLLAARATTVAKHPRGK